MNAKECNQRASDCASNAAIALDEPVALEFLRMAAQWRAMALRQVFIGHIPDRELEQDLPRLLAVSAN